MNMPFTHLLAQPTTIPSGFTPGSGWFLPEQASTIAPAIDFLFDYINAVSIVFTVGILALTVWWAWKYRSSVHPDPKPPGHNNVLEVVWTVVPGLLILVMFWLGFKGYNDMTVVPPLAKRVAVIGKTWVWTFNYPNPDGGADSVDSVLYAPVNEPVVLEMTSDDVIHSFYIPAFRVKKDVVPGRYNKLWFQATRTGEFPVYCTEYCGQQHSEMLTKVVVLEADAYAAKMKEIANIRQANKEYLSPVEIGKKLAALQGCKSCHSVDGTPGTGPTWKNLWGEPVPLASGKQVVADYDYVKESIYYPGKELVMKEDGSGSYGNAMPAAPQLDGEMVWYITQYMKSLSDKHAVEADVNKLTDDKVKEIQKQFVK